MIGKFLCALFVTAAPMAAVAEPPPPGPVDSAGIRPAEALVSPTVAPTLEACEVVAKQNPAWQDRIAEARLAEKMTALRARRIALREKQAKFHVVESARAATNNKFVIAAYAAMWILSALFLFFMWRKQKTLVDEIERLHGELCEASAE